MPLIPRFHTLTIADARRETADAVSLAFAVPNALADAYRFNPGQYLTLRRGDLRRAYSICSGVDDGELRIAIKRVPGGAVSEWAQTVAAGEALDVMTPTGRFGPTLDPACARTHVGICAGSGITPILSIAKSVLSRETRSRIVLLYGSRSTGDILFRAALEDLKDRHLGRLSVLHVLSQERHDVDVLNGRLDAEKLGKFLRAGLGGGPIHAAYICGPAPMLPAAEAALQDAGAAPEAIATERFTSSFEGAPRPAPAPPPHAPPFALARLIAEGVRHTIPVAEGEFVLDAALRAGLDLPFACKGGMCSTCRARVTSGAVAMAQNFSLEPSELAQGFVLTCQARPTTPEITVDFDAQ